METKEFFKSAISFIIGICAFCSCSSSSTDDEYIDDPNELTIEKVRDCSISLGCETLEEAERSDLLTFAYDTDVLNPTDAFNELKWRKELYHYFDFGTLYMFFAYYYSVVTWEATIEHQGGYSRKCSRNIKLDIKYLGCSQGTPERYIPKNEQDVHKTYPDIEGEWIKDSNFNKGDEDVSGGNSGSDNDDSGSNNNHQRDYLYVTKVNCYKENLDSDDLYIYKKNGGNEIRASWVYSAKGLDLAATEKVHYANKNINGTFFKYYINPFGICWYFNY